MKLIYPLIKEPELKAFGFIPFAQVGRPHGLKGAFFLVTQDQRTQWNNYKKILLKMTDAFYEFTVSNTYSSGGYLVLKLMGLDQREILEKIYKNDIYVHRSEILLNEDEYIVMDLINYKVTSSDIKNLGHVIGVTSFGAQDNLEIQISESNKSIFFPFISNFIEKVDHKKKEIVVVYDPCFFEDP